MTLLNQYSHEILGVNGILHHLRLTNAGCLHISQKARRYSTFEIGIKDLVIAELDVHYMHFIKLKSVGARPVNDDVDRIERILRGFRYPIDRDAEHIEWSIARGVLDAFLKCLTAQKLGIRALQWQKVRARA